MSRVSDLSETPTSAEGLSRFAKLPARSALAVMATLFLAWPPAASADPPAQNFITVEGDELMDGGDVFVIAGMSYGRWDGPTAGIPPTVFGHSQRWWYTYDPLEVRADLADIAGQGANTVRIFAPDGNVFEPAVGTFNTVYCDRLHDFLDAARDNDLRVVMSFGGTPVHYFQTFEAEFCDPYPGTACLPDNNYVSSFVTLSDPDLRAFHIDRVSNFMSVCDISNRTEIAALSPWNERKTGSYDDSRSHHAPVRAWNEWLRAKYGTGPTGADYVPNATAAWSYTPVTGETCGIAGDELCPPDDHEFCGTCPSGGACSELNATKMAVDYRRFADDTARDAFGQLADVIRSHDPNHLITSGFVFQVLDVAAGGTGGLEAECEAIGYYFDPRNVSPGILDFIAFHSYYWGASGLVSPYDDLTPFPELASRIEKLKFAFDYFRTTDSGDRVPVLLEEVGKVTLCGENEPACAGEKARREEIQRHVWRRTAELVMNSHINGALLWSYIDQIVPGVPFDEIKDYGAKYISGNPKAVYADQPWVMDVIKMARPNIRDSGKSHVADPTSHAVFARSLFENLDEYSVLRQNGIVAIERGRIEAGRTGADHTTRHVDFGSGADLDDPVVVLGPPTVNGPDQATTSRTAAVTPLGFDHFLQEWDYLDGFHLEETIGYLAVESGRSRLGGLVVEAGASQVSNAWATVAFEQTFPTVPVVFAQVASQNDASAVAIRLRNVSDSGFEIRLTEEEANLTPANGNGAHGLEDAHWIAVEPGSTSLGDRDLVVGVTGAVVSDLWYSLAFGTSVADPTLIAQIQTEVGADPVTLRYRNLTSSGVEIELQEEQSADSELWHIGESVGFLVIGD